MDHKIFKPVSMKKLTEDMVFPCDIYGDPNGKILILKKDNILTAARLEQLNRHHDIRHGLFVAEENVQLMIDYMRGYDIGEKGEKYYSADNHRRQKLEKETGFAAIKELSQDLFKEDSGTTIVQQDKTLNVSAELAHRLETTSPDLILSIVNMLVPEDEYLQQHIINVSTLNGIMGKWLGFSRKDVTLLILVGLLHDCGKNIIPPNVLNAPRAVSRVEFEVIKLHPLYGYNLLDGFPEIIRNGVRSHHEKINGKGYPDGLAMDKVPMLARITAVSDIYDAMVSRRIYKSPISPFHVMAMLNNLKGEELDPFFVDTLTSCMPKEMIGKSVLMSDGTTGIVDSVDPDDLEFPYIRIGDQTIKTDSQLYCLSMEI